MRRQAAVALVRTSRVKELQRRSLQGADGKYHLKVTYFDENDGNAEFKLYINDALADEWIADKDLGSANSDEKTLTTHTVTVNLSKDDIIQIEGKKETYDPARLDKIEVERTADLEASEPTITVDKVTVNITSNVSDKRNAVLIVASYENGVMKKYIRFR